MPREWILWNALKKPENTTKDERTEQIEWKSYYWCYKVLIRLLVVLLVLWPGILKLSKIYVLEDAVQEMLLQLLIFGVIAVIETGRFLYSCYHGNQEFYDSGKGKWNFISCSLLMGMYSWLVFWISCGIRHPLPWVMGGFGALLFILLGHLSYFHYALLADEETEERGRRSEKWIPALCIAVLVLYYSVVPAAGFLSFSKTADLTEAEQQMIQAVQRGIDDYHYLENFKMDYTFETDMDHEDADGYTDLNHASYLVSGGECYTQVLDSENGTICREFYREGEDGFRWYMAGNGGWISEEEWFRSWSDDMKEPEAWITQPVCGLYDLDPWTVDSIEKTYEDGSTCYMISYNDRYRGVQSSLKGRAEMENVSVTERYVINGYGALIEYEHTETGRMKTNGEPRVMRRFFTILSVDREEIRREIKSLREQYSYS